MYLTQWGGGDMLVHAVYKQLTASLMGTYSSSNIAVSYTHLTLPTKA